MIERRMLSLMACALAGTVTPALAAPVKIAAPVKAERPLLAIKADPATGKIVATLPKPDSDGISGRYLYLSQTETGLGSAPMVIDRGTSSSARILVFRRFGEKVIAEIENPKFVASAGTPAEQAAVRESFPTSVIWSGEVIKSLPDGGFTVDLADMLVRDDLGIARSIKQGGGGDFKFAKELSAADPNFVKLFPRNVELAARLTFRADEPTAEANNVLPGNDTMSLVVRHSLIRLPDPGYVSRSDPYGYSIARQMVDYSVPLGAPLVRDVARRFRLEKIDPAAARSAVTKPIIFHIDSGAPEPVRTALREGVAWWAEAFDAAGFVDAFKVEVLPAGADPLDVRYNVVNWANRATRGWSYGAPIDDPRTGEIVKGSVMLGSLRARQDMIIFQALMGAGLTGGGGPDDPVAATLARIRQLGAHEVGHAIGLAHNFASSTQGRYSVMDYPAPRIGIENGRLTLKDAYGSGIGPWDRFGIAWLYGARTDAEARPIIARGRADGLRFVSDDDTRPSPTGHPQGALWDDGDDSIVELGRIMEVRRLALARFGPDALPPGETLANLRRSFVPIWLLHRYQVDAAAKAVGGVDFPYAVRGEGGALATPVAGIVQRSALAALLDTLNPGALTVPARLQPLLSSGFGGNSDRQVEIEILPTAGGPVFDPLRATEIGAVHTLGSLLNPDRLNRLETQHAADRSIPAPDALIDAVIERSFAATDGEVGRRIATTAALALARLQRSPALSPPLALALGARLERLAGELGGKRRSDWSRGLAGLLGDREALDKAVSDPARLPRVPPGMPIG